MDDRGFESRQGLEISLFTTTSRPALRPIQPPIQWVPGTLTLEVKWPAREADLSYSSSAEVKNTWSYTCTPQYAFKARCSVKAQGQLYLNLVHSRVFSFFLKCTGGMDGMVTTTEPLVKPVLLNTQWILSDWLTDWLTDWLLNHWTKIDTPSRKRKRIFRTSLMFKFIKNTLKALSFTVRTKTLHTNASYHEYNRYIWCLPQ